MFLFIRVPIRPRKKPVFKKTSWPQIFQGVFILALGVVFMIANAGNGSPYKQISGHILDEYVHTLNNRYDSNWLHITTDPSDLYLFDKNTLHPTWTDPIFKGERVDIYYVDDTPRRIVALQLYDLYGNPWKKFTTTEYDSSVHSPHINFGFDIGIGLVVVGLVVAGYAIYRVFITWRAV